MPIDPPRSPDAHSQIGQSYSAAGSGLSQGQDPPALRDPRGFPAIGNVRAEVDGQPFSFAPGGVVGIPIRPRRSVPPIPALVLDSILDRRPNLHERLAANDRAYREAERKAEGGKIGLAIMFAIAVLLGLLLAAGGVV